MNLSNTPTIAKPMKDLSVLVFRFRLQGQDDAQRTSIVKYTDFMKPEDISIENCWKVIAGALFKNENVSQVQHDEMRRTFYMGFTECFKIMNDLADVMSEAGAADILSKINDEATAFHAKEIGKLLPNRPTH